QVRVQVVANVDEGGAGREVGKQRAPSKMGKHVVGDPQSVSPDESSVLFDPPTVDNQSAGDSLAVRRATEYDPLEREQLGASRQSEPRLTPYASPIEHNRLLWAPCEFRGPERRQRGRNTRGLVERTVDPFSRLLRHRHR